MTVFKRNVLIKDSCNIYSVFTRIATLQSDINLIKSFTANYQRLVFVICILEFTISGIENYLAINNVNDANNVLSYVTSQCARYLENRKAMSVEASVLEIEIFN